MSRDHRLSPDKPYPSVGDVNFPKVVRNAAIDEPEPEVSAPCTTGPLSLNEHVGQTEIMSTSIVLSEPSPQLATLDRARQMLAESRTLSEVKKIRDIAEAARTYAKAAHLGRESQNYAAEIALLAACKAGEILKQLDKSQGGRPNEKTAASVAAVSEYAQTLKETNTPERTARYWQELSNVPEAKVTEYIASVHKAEGGEITSSGLLKACRVPKPKSPRQETREGVAKALEAENLFPGYDVRIAPGGLGDAVEITFLFPHLDDARVLAKKLQDADRTADEFKAAVRLGVKERLAEIADRKRVA